MIRIIVGAVLFLFSMMGIMGMFMEENAQYYSTNIIVFPIVLLSGIILLAFGIKFLKQRQEIINLVLKLQREEGIVYFSRVSELLRIDEIKLRKSINYAMKKGWVNKSIEIK